MPSSIQTAVVTGAASGIGKALARRLREEGYALALCDVNDQALTALAEELGGDVLTWAVDVRDREAVFDFAGETLKRFGRVDLVINNAGVALAVPFMDMTYEDLEWVMDINFWGVMHGCKAFLPSMIAQGSGHLVNISSSFGLVGIPTQSAYNAAKFAVRGVTECLRQELNTTGVGVTCVHPGGIKTNIARHSRFHEDHEGNRNREAFVKRFDAIAKISTEKAAEVILAGVRKGKPRVLIGGDARVIDWLARWFPNSYEFKLRRLFDLLR
ncbi:MAG: SDR family oxidoreductase [Acidobacteriota bacterium]|nr:SDR family oxidoreductase [Acidobacteriota bacterium]